MKNKRQATESVLPTIAKNIMDKTCEQQGSHEGNRNNNVTNTYNQKETISERLMKEEGRENLAPRRLIKVKRDKRKY